jgi:hypothetical protein
MRMQAHVAVGFILSSVEDPDPHHFGLDQDPDQSRKPDPDPHQSEKVEA